MKATGIKRPPRRQRPSKKARQKLLESSKRDLRSFGPLKQGRWSDKKVRLDAGRPTRKPRKGSGLKTRTNPTLKGVLTSRLRSGAADEVSFPNSFKSSVTASALIVGNRKDPLAWTYIIDQRTGPKGRVIWNKSDYRLDSVGSFSVDDGGTQIGAPRQASNLYNKALDRLNEKVRGSLDLSVSIAEAGQTAKMLRLTDTAVNAAKEMFSSRINRVKRVANFLSNRWLEWQYGWKPLINDIYDAADESLRHVLNRLQRVSASASEKYSTEMKTYNFVGQSYQAATKYEGKSGRRFSIWVDVGNDTNLDRWTSLNPASIAWELMPYSFVVDWFYDVGGYIRNLETALLYQTKFKSGFTTSLDAFGAGYRLFGAGSASSLTGNNVIVEGQARRYISFQRSVLTSYPLPRPPTFHADLGGARLLSAAALLQQFWEGKRPELPPRLPWTDRDLRKRWPKQFESHLRH